MINYDLKKKKPILVIHDTKLNYAKREKNESKTTYEPDSDSHGKANKK